LLTEQRTPLERQIFGPQRFVYDATPNQRVDYEWKYLPGSAVLFSVMLVCSMVLVTLSASAFSVVHERMLEEKALARLRIEECLDVAEHMYNTKNGEKLSFSMAAAFCGLKKQ